MLQRMSVYDLCSLFTLFYLIGEYFKLSVLSLCHTVNHTVFDVFLTHWNSAGCGSRQKVNLTLSLPKKIFIPVVQHLWRSLKEGVKAARSVCFENAAPHRTLWFILCGKYGSPHLGKTTAAARAALPIPISVCSIGGCPNSGVAASVWDFLTCAQLLMHTEAVQAL